MLETLAGVPFEQYVRENVLDPLSLDQMVARPEAPGYDAMPHDTVNNVLTVVEGDDCFAARARLRRVRLAALPAVPHTW